MGLDLKTLADAVEHDHLFRGPVDRTIINIPDNLTIESVCVLAMLGPRAF